MSEIKACDVCCGRGDYPVINKFAETLYYIQCPQCCGTGSVDMENADPPEEPELPPRSTAASIQSIKEMREYIAENWTEG